MHSPSTTLQVPPLQPRHPTRPATRPNPLSHQACHPIWPTTTLPATPPCRPAFPDNLARLVSHDGVASVAML